MSKIIGIDLGTTNSRVAVMEGGKPSVIPDKNGKEAMPSLAVLSGDGERWVGEEALQRTGIKPDRVMVSGLRGLGTAKTERFGKILQKNADPDRQTPATMLFCSGRKGYTAPREIPRRRNNQ